jgi:hypothetical protein
MNSNSNNKNNAKYYVMMLEVKIQKKLPINYI